MRSGGQLPAHFFNSIRRVASRCDNPSSLLLPSSVLRFRFFHIASSASSTQRFTRGLILTPHRRTLPAQQSSLSLPLHRPCFTSCTSQCILPPAPCSTLGPNALRAKAEINIPQAYINAGNAAVAPAHRPRSVVRMYRITRENVGSVSTTWNSGPNMTSDRVG